MFKKYHLEYTRKMELVIPLIALGGLYMASKNNKNPEENNNINKSKNSVNEYEGFQSERLPNVDIPDKNVFQESPFLNEELDKTSKLSTLNKYDTPSAYTDKYFADVLYPETTAVNSFTSMTGKQVNGDYFQHNNMTPYFGAKIRSAILDPESTEGVLDNYSGSGTQYITKQEQSPLFSPGENYQYANGAPNVNDFFQSRVNPSMRMANVKPFESQNVGPGLGLGGTTEGSGGFNSGMARREDWMPKNVDQMRVNNKQRSSGIGLFGHEGPASSHIHSIATTEQMGRMEKNRVERTWDMGNGERNFTTTGIEKGATMHAIPIDRFVNRPETTASYVGNAGTHLPETYTPGKYMDSKHIDLGQMQLGVASLSGRQTGTESDYEMKAKKAYPNNRTENSQDTYFGAFKTAVSAVVAPLLDELRPSRRENVMGTLRPYQNAHTGISNSYLFNPADRPTATIRETTEQNKYVPGINTNQNGGAYQTTEHSAPKQNRDTTSLQYTGNSSAAAGTKQLRPHDAEYRQRNNAIKSSTIEGHMVAGNMNIPHHSINMRNRPGEIKNERALTQTAGPKQSTGISFAGQSHSKQQYNSTIQLERNTPDMMKSLQSNPYTQKFYQNL
jgi:hypothetical protein